MVGQASPDLPDHVHDRVVAAAIAGGDEAVFVDLVRQLSPAMLRAATSYTRSHAVAEEVVQETWLAVLRGIAAYEGRSSLRTWVQRICVNLAARRAASEGRSRPFSDVFDDGPTVDETRFHPADARDNPRGWASPPSSWRSLPEDRVLGAESREVVTAAVDGLPHRQRRVLVLRDVEGYTADEVCQILQLSEANQRVLLHRARAQLRASLEDHWRAS